jgi:hypothetical protein
MHHLLRLVLFLLLHAATFSAAATGGVGACNRQCSDTTVVPYPFGFSGDCPILLTCNATISNQPLLPHSTAAEAYPIISFRSNASTFLVSVAPSCNRTVRGAEASLSGAHYGISHRTSLLLRGGGACRSPSSTEFNCSVQAGIMTRVLRTAQCRGAGAGGVNDTSFTCVAASGEGRHQFELWEMVRKSGCQDALTATLYGDVPSVGVASLDFGVAELGWWLDGTCAAAGQCATNATCRDVETPSGAPGHRCACRDGWDGDGFAAGDGCHDHNGGECFALINRRRTVLHCCHGW